MKKINKKDLRAIALESIDQAELARSYTKGTNLDWYAWTKLQASKKAFIRRFIKNFNSSYKRAEWFFHRTVYFYPVMGSGDGSFSIFNNLSIIDKLKYKRKRVKKIKAIF